MIADLVDWQTPAGHPELAAHQVHIWRTGLDVTDDMLESYRQLLSSDERERAQRFVFERDRRRYSVARAVLRHLLAAYLQVAAGDLVFTYEKHGKPVLAWPHNATIAFNLSHSNEWAVYGFTQHGRIGIDIEYHRSIKDLHQLAASIFCEQELVALHAVPTQQQQATFYAGWTRKEAFIKALGQGLAFPLKQCAVSLAPGEPARMLHPAEVQHWHMASFSPAPTVSGAVVVESPAVDVTFWHVPSHR